MISVVVLDVNTLASAAATADGPPGLIVNAVVDGRFQLVVSDHILNKLHEVLQRPYFRARLGGDARGRYITTLERSALLIQPDHSVRGIAKDEEDDAVLGTAVAAKRQLPRHW